MRVAIVHPTNWPQVRRGTERFMNEFARFLADHGHSPTIITSHPGGASFETRDGIVTEYHRSLWAPWMARYGVLDFHVFPMRTLTRVASRRFDVIHTFNFTDTLAACFARKWTAVPVVLHLNTIPPPAGYRPSLSTGGALLKRAIESADCVLTISRKQQDYFDQRFKRASIRLQAPVDLRKFPLFHARDASRPILLCASALQDRRKGGRLLMRAFNEVKRVRGEVLLELCHPTAPALRSELLQLVEPQWRDSVLFTEPKDERELAASYGRAAALVLPSLWEAFPMVVIEALACGTPVAGTRDSGITELLSNPSVGRTFDPGSESAGEPTNAAGLTQAILEVLDLSVRPDTAHECRRSAAQYDWEKLGPRYVQLYESLLTKKAHDANAAI